MRKLVEENGKMERLLGEREDELEGMRGEFGEIGDKVENEMSVKVNMMINEVDRLGCTLDLRNDEVSGWKKKFDELEVGNSRQVQDLEGAVYRLKSELSRLESALKQRESRLNELENIVRTQDVRIKECQDENWYLKKDNEAYANKVSVLEPELENSKSQKKRLDLEIGEMKKNIHSIAKRVENSETDNEFLRAENGGLKSSNKEVQKANSELVSERNSLGSQLVTVTKDSKEKSQLASDLTDEVNRLNGHLVDFKEKIQKMHTENNSS